jgi:hypothetical protein
MAYFTLPWPVLKRNQNILPNFLVGLFTGYVQVQTKACSSRHGIKFVIIDGTKYPISSQIWSFKALELSFDHFSFVCSFSLTNLLFDIIFSRHETVLQIYASTKGKKLYWFRMTDVDRVQIYY